MHLEDNVYRNEATFKKLISCCPVLEDLTVIICGNDKTVFQVHSLSLKTLTLARFSLLRCSATSGVVINAPLLCSLRIKDNISKSFIVKNLGSNAKLDISILFGLWDFDKANLASESSIRRFLQGVSKVRKIIICPSTFKLLCQYAKLGPLPQFHNMSRLYVTLCVYDLELLPTFLESFPNLKSIILDSNQNSKKMSFDESSQIKFSSVPECLLSSLEFVNIESSNFGYVARMSLVRYLLKNSTILKKLTICLNYSSPNDFILKKLREIPRRSIACQVSTVFD